MVRTDDACGAAVDVGEVQRKAVAGESMLRIDDWTAGACAAGRRAAV